MTAVEQLAGAIQALDADGLLDERARHRVLVTTLGAFGRELEAARAVRDSGQLTLDAAGGST